MSQASALYHLQTLDLEIASQRARLDEVNAILGTNTPVRKAQIAAKRAKDRVDSLQARVTDLDLEIGSNRNKYQETETRLYSGKVKNPKELQDMQQEVASLKRRNAQLEDEMLEAMMSLEEHQARYQKALRRLKRVKRKWDEDQADLAEEKIALKASLEALVADREAAWGAIDAESQVTYENVQAKKGAQPVALLTSDGICSHCGVKQTSRSVQRLQHDNSIVKCSGCGRILFAK